MPIDRRSALSLLGASSAFSIDGGGPAAAEPGSVPTAEGVDLWMLLTPAMRADVLAGTLRVDCAPAFQRAIDLASGRAGTSFQTGRRLVVRAGRYRIDRPLAFAWRGEQGIADDGDMRRPTILGEGQANTGLYYFGPATDPALTIRGFKAPGDGVVLRLAIEGLRILRPPASSRRGIGLALDGVAMIDLADVEIAGFDRNLVAVDVLRFSARNLMLNGGTIGLHARGDRFSNPNVFDFVNCAVAGNKQDGAVFQGATNIRFDSCTFEGNGVDRLTGAAIRFEGGPEQGGAQALLSNCYFEDNLVAADVVFDWRTPHSGTAKLLSCTFTRSANGRAPSHHLSLHAEGGATMLVHVDSCAFKTFAGFAASPAHRAVTVSGTGVRLTGVSNYFSDPADAIDR